MLLPRVVLVVVTVLIVAPLRRSWADRSQISTFVAARVDPVGGWRQEGGLPASLWVPAVLEQLKLSGNSARAIKGFDRPAAPMSAFALVDAAGNIPVAYVHFNSAGTEVRVHNHLSVVARLSSPDPPTTSAAHRRWVVEIANMEGNAVAKSGLTGSFTLDARDGRLPRLVPAVARPDERGPARRFPGLRRLGNALSAGFAAVRMVPTDAEKKARRAVRDARTALTRERYAYVSPTEQKTKRRERLAPAKQHLLRAQATLLGTALDGIVHRLETSRRVFRQVRQGERLTMRLLRGERPGHPQGSFFTRTSHAILERLTHGVQSNHRRTAPAAVSR